MSRPTRPSYTRRGGMAQQDMAPKQRAPPIGRRSAPQTPPTSTVQRPHPTSWGRGDEPRSTWGVGPQREKRSAGGGTQPSEAELGGSQELAGGSEPGSTAAAGREGRHAAGWVVWGKPGGGGGSNPKGKLRCGGRRETLPAASAFLDRLGGGGTPVGTNLQTRGG